MLTEIMERPEGDRGKLVIREMKRTDNLAAVTRDITVN